MKDGQTPDVTPAPVAVPEGYMTDSMGRLVPVNLVSDLDKERDALVRELVGKAKGLQDALSRYKAASMGDIEAFVELSGEKYGKPLGGKKGNVTLHTFDGAFKVKRTIGENLVFDERLQVAKGLIDECLKEWTADGPDEIKALINDAFQVDKEGRVNTARILSLRKIEIQDHRWNDAMQAISDSLTIAGSKPYVRVYERQDDGSYKALPLDIAAL